ncbi:hypothetical protein ACL90Y_08415 [Micrococcus luteus]
MRRLALSATLGLTAALALTGCVQQDTAPSGAQDRPEQAIAGSVDHELTEDELKDALLAGFEGMPRPEIEPIEQVEDSAELDAEIFAATAPDLESCLESRGRMEEAEEKATLSLHGPAPLDGVDPVDSHASAYVFPTAQDRHDFEWLLAESEVVCDPQRIRSRVVEHEGRRVIETDLSHSGYRTLAHSMSDGNVMVWASVAVRRQDREEIDVESIRAARAAALDATLTEIAGDQRHDSTPLRLPEEPQQQSADPDGPDAGELSRERLGQALTEHAVPQLPEQRQGAAGSSRDPSEVHADAPSGLQHAALAVKLGEMDGIPAQCTERSASLMDKVGGLDGLTVSSVEAFTEEPVPESGRDHTGGDDEALLRHAYVIVDTPSVESARAVAEASAGAATAACEPDRTLGTTRLPSEEGSEDVAHRTVLEGRMAAENETRLAVRRGDLVAVAELDTVHSTGSPEHLGAAHEAHRTLTQLLDAVTEAD